MNNSVKKREKKKKQKKIPLVYAIYFITIKPVII